MIEHGALPSRARAATAPAAVFAVMLAGMVVLPAMRPLLATRGAAEGAMHAFLSAGMFGAVLLVPVFGLAADRGLGRRRTALALLLVDALAALACTAPMPLPALLALRFVEGAANVGALSLAMSLDASPHGRGMAARGAAMMGALVVGSPLGGLLVGLDARAPFYAAALALVGAMLLVGLAPDAPREPTARRAGVVDRPSVVVACAVSFAERFSVGAFVVTFTLRAHGSLGMSDRAIGLAFAAMLVPFALAMYPVARFGARLRRTTLVALGATVYAAAFLGVATARGPALALALALAGVASALLYAPALCWAAEGAPSGARGTRMALFHAAGCLGMALGPAFAGVASATLRRAAIATDSRHALVLALAGLAPLVASVVVSSKLQTLRAAEARPYQGARGRQ